MLSWLSRSLIVHSTNDCIFVFSGRRRFTVHVQKEPAANVAGFTSGQTSDQAAISGFRPDKKKGRFADCSFSFWISGKHVAIIACLWVV